MRTRVTSTVAVFGLAATILLSGCGEPADQDTSAPTPSASSEPTQSEPEATATDEAGAGVPRSAEDLVGDWRDDEADWTVHFEADGTFTEDYEGIVDFRTGDYAFEDGEVSLIGGDGNTDTGQVEGETLVFTLGTLTRQ